MADDTLTEAKANLYDAAAAWNCATTSEQDKEAGEAFKAAMDALSAAVRAETLNTVERRLLELRDDLHDDARYVLDDMRK